MAVALVLGCGDRAVTVYLVRHAEKAVVEASSDAAKDPPLSEQGRRRADGLAKAVAGVELRAVFATQFKRTQETVEPAAKAHGLSVEVVSADDVAGLVAKIRAHAGATVLVAGHSNTVPEIAAKLGVKDALTLGDGDYGDLFIVESKRGSGALQRKRFEP
ncbi:MAG: phosphoglycerate mutase family protein [Polyangiaceae bacterium]